MPGLTDTTVDMPVRNKFKAPKREPAVVGDTGLFGDVDPELQSMISGEAFDPIEMEMQSAMGRMERTGRAAAARGLGRFAGQGAGMQSAQDVDTMLAGNRLQGLLNIGTGRQETKERGVSTMLNRIGQEEGIRQGRDEIRLAGERLDLSRLDSDRRYKLSQNAQKIQEAYQNGQLSVQQAQLELQKLIQQTNAEMSKRQQNLAEWPARVQQEKLQAWEEQKGDIATNYDPLQIPNF